MEEKIELICVSKYPFIEVMGIGKYEKGKKYEFPANIAEKLVVSSEWEKVKKTKPILKKTEFKFEKKKTKFNKKKEVKNA